jgi:hypothetical protein
MRYRLFAAALAALALAALPAEAQSAKARIAAAKKAEKAKNYKKMLSEYQAACAAEPSAECQLGIADAYAKLGQPDKARAAYNNIINDPFAQDTYVSKAKGHLEKLASAGDAAPALPSLDLPAPDAAPALPSLDLPAAPAEKKSKSKKGKTEVAAAAPAPSLDLPPLDLPPALPDAAPAAKKGKKDTKVAAAPPPSLDLPPLDLPPPAAEPAPAVTAKKDKKKDTKPADLPPPPSLDLPPLDLPPPAAEPVATAKKDKKKDGKKKADQPAVASQPGDLPLPSLEGLPPLPGEAPAKVASNEPDLALPATPDAKPTTNQPVAKGDGIKKPKGKTGDTKVASNDKGTAAPAKGVLASNTATNKVNEGALVAPPMDRYPQPGSSSGVQRTFAWVTAGVAVAAVGFGGLSYSQSSSAQSDLTSAKRTRAAQGDLVDKVNSKRTLSAIGLAGGLAAGGLATVLFAF